MKQAKRDITLTEKDSIYDMLEVEKALAREYLEACFLEEKKERREEFLTSLKAVAETVFMLDGLWKARE